ncbi:MAG: DUF5916 domain-containing protein [Acidobacteriota bacterium]
MFNTLTKSPVTIFLHQTALLFCTAFSLSGPAFASDRPTVDITFLETPPVIDGEIGDDEWAGAAVLDQGFIQFKPEFGEPSPFRTVVRIGQTEDALYLAFTAFDPDPSRLAASVTQRDGNIVNDDSISFFLDTFDSKRTAFTFGTNALGAQWDGRIADNGRTLDHLWDEAWDCASQRGNDRWTAEFEIPFAILRYPPGSDRVWGLNILRNIPRRIEMSLWSKPAEGHPMRVTAFGTMRGIVPPTRDQKSWQAIPYAVAIAEENQDTDFEIGGDFRWRPSSLLGVDLTLNPDFALIEADVEAINLSRFELFVPEKRPFFLEGNEMYQQRIHQFYSRRIGDITWGGKGFGTVAGTDFSVIATSEDRELNPQSTSSHADYGVARFQHSLPGGSTIGVLAANRRLEGTDQGSIGFDSTLFFSEKLSLTAQFISVHGPTADGGLAWFIRPAYDDATTHLHVRLTNLDEHILEDFNAVGFMYDDNRKEIDTNFSKTFWVKKGAVEKINVDTNYNRYQSQEDVLRSWELDANVAFIFRSGWELGVAHIDEFKLFEKEFRNDRTVLTAGWDGRDGHRISVHAGSGVNFGSDLLLYGANVAWKFGDRLRLSCSATRLDLDPDPENNTTWIHVLETLYAFNPDLYVKLFVQANSAIDKLNIQAVGVWRFKPPFGSIQLAYQRGTSALGQSSDQGNTLFTKLSWVF